VAHHYCVKCGSKLEPRVIEGRTFEACPNDDFVLWHDPKVVTSVVVEHAGGVLLGRRTIEPMLGLWCLPGGFVNDDEHPRDAAVRECREEICAEVEITKLLGVYHIAKRTAPSMVGIAYIARVSDGHRPQPGLEMSELGTFTAGSLPELAFPSHREILAEYFDAGSSTASRPSPPRTQSPRSRKP
jgi:ADP-ribose pyrophosphatase YjhB (NUDIX family)